MASQPDNVVIQFGRERRHQIYCFEVVPNPKKFPFIWAALGPFLNILLRISTKAQQPEWMYGTPLMRKCTTVI